MIIKGIMKPRNWPNMALKVMNTLPAHSGMKYAQPIPAPIASSIHTSRFTLTRFRQILMLSKYVERAVQRLDEGFYFLARVIYGKRRADGAGYTEAFHQRLRAVVSGADGHALLVE